MEIEKADSSSSTAVENVEEQSSVEEHLVTYLQNILKHQIVPMNYLNLRKLVKQAPQKLKLYAYIQQKYPGPEFLEFFQKFPQFFQVNPDKTVQIQGPSYCVQPTVSLLAEKSYDEVDGCDRGEYVSDQSSDSEDDGKISDSD